MFLERLRSLKSNATAKGAAERLLLKMPTDITATNAGTDWFFYFLFLSSECSCFTDD